MSKVIVLNMLSDENDRFLRSYEIPESATLLDLHNFICRDLVFTPDLMSSFFASDAQWGRLAEYTAMDMGGDGETGAPVPMENVTLGKVASKPHDRLIYQFDPIEGRALYMETFEVKDAEPGVAYPYVAQSIGDAPDQFDISGEGSSGGSIFDDAMEDFNDFAGDDSYDDDM